MTWIRTVPEDHAAGALKELYQRDIDTLGFVSACSLGSLGDSDRKDGALVATYCAILSAVRNNLGCCAGLNE